MIDLLGQATDGQPWWVSLILGSGGVALVCAFAVWALWKEYQKKSGEVTEITRESITVITKVLERGDAQERWNDEMRTSIQKIVEHVKGDDDWRKQAMDKIDRILTR